MTIKQAEDCQGHDIPDTIAKVPPGVAHQLRSSNEPIHERKGPKGLAFWLTVIPGVLAVLGFFGITSYRSLLDTVRQTPPAQQAAAPTAEKPEDRQEAYAPPAPTPGTYADFQAHHTDRIFFDSKEDMFSPDRMAVIDDWIKFFRDYPENEILIEGHCDPEEGNREYALALGEARATTVRDYLVERGIPASRIKQISYGKERPVVADAADDRERRVNRRVVIVLQ